MFVLFQIDSRVSGVFWFSLSSTFGLTLTTTNMKNRLPIWKIDYYVDSLNESLESLDFLSRALSDWLSRLPIWKIDYYINSLNESLESFDSFSLENFSTDSWEKHKYQYENWTTISIL